MIFTVTPNPAIDQELTVETLEWNEVLPVSASRRDCGGKGFNVSRALAGMGKPSSALAFVGSNASEWMGASLRADGITPLFIPISGETRVNTSIIAVAGGRYVKANQPGPLVSQNESARLLDTIREIAVPGSWWALCGSLPRGLDFDFYRRIIGILNERGANTLLDSSGEALREGALARPTLIKPNAAETRQLTGEKVQSIQDAAQACRRLWDCGIPQAVITLGARGAVYATGRQIWSAAPPAIREANPIGAGDALAAGLLFAISRQFDPADTLAWAVACGASAAALPGTAMPDIAQIREILPRVKVSSL